MELSLKILPGDSDIHSGWNVIDRVIVAEVKSSKVGEVPGFGNERSFSRGMLRKPDCIRLKGGPEVRKWKQQIWVAHFRKFAIKI